MRASAKLLRTSDVRRIPRCRAHADCHFLLTILLVPILHRLTFAHPPKGYLWPGVLYLRRSDLHRRSHLTMLGSKDLQRASRASAASPVAECDKKQHGDFKSDDLLDDEDFKKFEKADGVREIPSLRLDTGDVRLKIREHAWQIW